MLSSVVRVCYQQMTTRVDFNLFEIFLLWKVRRFLEGRNFWQGMTALRLIASRGFLFGGIHYYDVRCEQRYCGSIA